MRLAARRIPMMVVGLLSMGCGMWLGLVRLGWNLPLPWQDQLIAHGPLMVCGFLGTLISLERAVAFGSRWGYAAPVLIATGALMLDLGPLGAFVTDPDPHGRQRRSGRDLHRRVTATGVSSSSSR